MQEERDINDPRWKAARFATFARDGYLCQLCNVKGKKLECHHIVRWADNLNLRFILGNLITLCVDCHKEVTGKEERYVQQFKNIIAKKRFSKDYNKFNKNTNQTNFNNKRKIKYKPTNPRWFF